MSIEGQGHIVTLAQGHFHMKITTCFCSETIGPFLTKFCMYEGHPIRSDNDAIKQNLSL